MRDIKFRGKTFKEEWIMGDLMHTPGDTGDGVAIQYWNETDGWMTEDVQADSVGQFTGLFDDYKVPIFEGDIVETSVEDKERIGRLLVVSDGPKKLRGVVKYDIHSAKYMVMFERNKMGENSHMLSSEFGWDGFGYQVVGKYYEDKFKLQEKVD